MIDADPGTKFTASLVLGPAMTGLVGTLAVRIVDPGVQETPVPRTTDGINEYPLGTGTYGVELTAPLAPGLYVVMWDIAPVGPYTTENSWGEELTIIIENPTYPGGWSWTPYGWLQPAWWGGYNISTGTPGSNTIPDACYIRKASKLNFDQYGFECDAGPGGLQEVVDRAESVFWRITGQTLDRIEEKGQAVVRWVIQGMAEYMVVSSTEDVIDTGSDWDMISGFAAGPYNENRRSPADMWTGRMLFPVPRISQMLWSLLTEERYGYYWQLFTGNNIPAFETSDVFWETGLELGNLWGNNTGYGGYLGGA